MDNFVILRPFSFQGWCRLDELFFLFSQFETHFSFQISEVGFQALRKKGRRSSPLFARRAPLTDARLNWFNISIRCCSFENGYFEICKEITPRLETPIRLDRERNTMKRGAAGLARSCACFTPGFLTEKRTWL